MELKLEWCPSQRFNLGEHFREAAETADFHLSVHSTRPEGGPGTWIPRVNGETLVSRDGGVLCCETADRAKAEATLEARRRLAVAERPPVVSVGRDEMEAELARFKEAFRYMARRDPDPTCWRGYTSPLGPEAREFAEDILAGKSLKEIGRGEG